MSSNNDTSTHGSLIQSNLLKIGLDRINLKNIKSRNNAREEMGEKTREREREREMRERERNERKKEREN